MEPRKTRPRHRRLSPMLEQVEPRELPSTVTNLIIANHNARMNATRARAAQALVSAASGKGFVLSRTSIATPDHQGTQGTNLAVTPTGTFTKGQLRRQIFTAVYQGTYSIGPGRTSTEAAQVFIRGAGTASSMLHSDIQIQIIMPKDPTEQISGVTTMFDRNLNSNSALGLDLSAPNTNVDGNGRPNLLTNLSLDPNISAGVYVEGYSQGIMKIHYMPSGKRSPGILDQGKAIVKIQAQVYAPQTSFILRNADINP